MWHIGNTLGLVVLVEHVQIMQHKGCGTTGRLQILWALEHPITTQQRSSHYRRDIAVGKVWWLVKPGALPGMMIAPAASRIATVDRGIMPQKPRQTLLGP